MPFRFRYGMVILLLALLALLFVQTAAQAQTAGLGSDLFYLSKDPSGIVQVWSIDTANTVKQITQEAANVVAFDVSYDNRVAYVTARSLSVGAAPVTTGGPLDSPDLQLADVSWSPTAAQVAVVALSPSGAANPSEGVWLYSVSGGTWTLTLSSTRSDPANTLVYRAVAWAESGDRLVLDTDFSADTAGTVIYSLSTGRSLALNQAGTSGIIDPKGYGRGNLSLNGASIVLSDVPGVPTGNGFLVDVNNYTRIVPLVGPEYESRYLSHAIPIRNGTAFFIRDFGNNIPTSEVWQLSYSGARVALGSIPNADLGFAADWTEDGRGLAYINQVDQASGFGTLHIFQRVEDAMQEVPLPAGVGQVASPIWGPNLAESTFTQVVRIVFTEPLFEFLDETGKAYYSLRAQWNPVQAGNGNYRITISPGFDNVGTFEVTGVAAKFNKMPCETTFTITIAAYDATGAAGAESEAQTVTTPPCSAQIYPVINDLYAAAAAAPPPAAPTTAAPTAPAAAAPTTPAPTPVEPPAVDQGGPSTVTDLAVGSPAQEGALADGSALFGLDLTWTAPAQAVPFFLVVVSPPFGENQRDRVPVRAQGSPTVTTRLTGLVCNVEYTIKVQSIADDGITILSNSNEVKITMPPCG